jgi:hypothetical protein
MSMIRWGDRLVPRAIIESVLASPPAGTCQRCGGLGEYPESIHEDRPDEMVPCFLCRRFCKACGHWVARAGHECKPTVGVTRHGHNDPKA